VSFDPLALLRDGTPFLDVRAPAEFAQGAVPGARNHPLLNDDERTRVGITYKQQGHDAAVRVGHRLVQGAVKETRVTAWRGFARAHPDAWIYCWRGGERSAITQQWLAEAGTELPRVPGGYKALRHACIDLLARAAAEDRRWIVLSGRTGSGKTRLINMLANAIDLEGLARHRGSAFGAREMEQPSPATFENALAVEWLRHTCPVLVLEDESRTIGRLALPEAWFQRMQRSPVAVLETPFAERCANIVSEYVDEPIAGGMDPRTLHARYSAALARIERRLGGLRRQRISAALDEGFTSGSHEHWVALLLEWYYDPMYDHQLAAKQERTLWRGSAEELRERLVAAIA
jgi:tRNA 2-selenouridine synthase